MFNLNFDGYTGGRGIAGAAEFEGLVLLDETGRVSEFLIEIVFGRGGWEGCGEGTFEGVLLVTVFFELGGRLLAHDMC